MLLCNQTGGTPPPLSYSCYLEGDALNVALLVLESKRVGLVGALTAHYGLPGRLADDRLQFERTIQTSEEDSSIFATALETLAIKAFGDMGQTARLFIIRDRFVARHDRRELHRHLESVPPETPIRDIVNRCRVWESHAVMFGGSVSQDRTGHFRHM